MRNNKLVIFMSFFVFGVFNSNTQWIEQVSGSNLTKYNVRFVNENTGWVTGTNSLILKTTNSGINWFQQVAPIPAGRELNGIQMFNANTGYIIGWGNIVIKTTNSGNNWIQLPGPSENYGSLNGVSFVNENTGWVCSSLGIIWKTTNGGNNWDSLFTGNVGTLRDIQFINEQTGWVVGDVGYMRKTTNGGLNWFFQFFATFSDFYYNSLFFINDNTGWVVSYNDKVFKTTNAGANWDSVSSTPGICIFFANSLTGWTGGDNGDIYKTTNGGTNFYLQTIPNSGGFFTDICFLNDTVGWATKVQRIYNTTDGGGEFVGFANSSIELPHGYNLKQNYPNPFNPNTMIEFEIQKDDDVRLIVYDILGSEIQQLVASRLKAGKYSKFFDGSNLSTGIYFYTLYYSGGRFTKKMILNK